MSSKQSGQKMLSFFSSIPVPICSQGLGLFSQAQRTFVPRLGIFVRKLGIILRLVGGTKRTLKTIAGIKYNTQEAIDEVTQQRTKSGYK